MTYLSIEKPAVSWAKEILGRADYERRNTAQELTAAGFNVYTQAGGYSLFYEKGDVSGL